MTYLLNDQYFHSLKQAGQSAISNGQGTITYLDDKLRNVGQQRIKVVGNVITYYAATYRARKNYKLQIINSTN